MVSFIGADAQRMSVIRTELHLSREAVSVVTSYTGVGSFRTEYEGLTMAMDTVFVNGTILTIDQKRPTAEAVGILGNRIVAVGDKAEVMAGATATTRTIDLDGRTLIPGINDNHTHPMSFGQALSQIDATPAAAPTLAALQGAFRERAAESGGEGWLIARGYDDTRLDIHRHPTRYELDEATGNQPAILIRTCGHLCVANSAALRIGGVTAETAAPMGGQIDHDESGEPIGLLQGNGPTSGPKSRS